MDASAVERVQMCIGWKRPWPFPVKQIRVSKETTRAEAVHAAQSYFEMSPNVVGVFVRGETWKQMVTRDGYEFVEAPNG